MHNRIIRYYTTYFLPNAIIDNNIYDMFWCDLRFFIMWKKVSMVMIAKVGSPLRLCSFEN